MNRGWHPLPWQLDAWSRLTGLTAENRLAHALLLAGPRGVGKGHFALGLASFLLCESPDAARKPCGECRSCIQIASGVHPNLLRLTPAEDKREIAVDDVRILIDRLHLSSHYGQVKVALIEPADALNTNGVNALLKTIEEPLAGTHLFLVAERWRALPATLRSRCQILRFAPPPADLALAWLKEHHPSHSATVLKTVVLTPMLAEKILEKESAEARAQWGRALTELAEGRTQVLKLADKLKREEAQAWLEFWLYCGAGWLKARLAPHCSEAGPVQPAPKSATVESIQRLLFDTVEGLRGLERNGNPAMILESIMIRFAKGKSN